MTRETKAKLIDIIKAEEFNLLDLAKKEGFDIGLAFRNVFLDFQSLEYESCLRSQATMSFCGALIYFFQTKYGDSVKSNTIFISMRKICKVLDILNDDSLSDDDVYMKLRM